MIFGDMPIGCTAINTLDRGVREPLDKTLAVIWEITETQSIEFDIRWNVTEIVGAKLETLYNIQEYVAVDIPMYWDIYGTAEIDFAVYWVTNYFNTLNHSSTYCVPKQDRNFVYRCNLPTECECEDDKK